MDHNNLTTTQAEGSGRVTCHTGLLAVFWFLCLAYGLFQGGWDILQACGRWPFSNLAPLYPYRCRPLEVVLMHFSAGVLCVVEAYLLFTLHVRQRHTNLLRPKILGMVGLCLALASCTLIAGDALTSCGFCQ